MNIMKRSAAGKITTAAAERGAAQPAQDNVASAHRRRRKQPKTAQTVTNDVVEPPDGLTRCGWVGMYKGAGSAAYTRYHDVEWGRPVHDDNQLFELLVLEGAQAGLSWSTILGKRDAYRQAFKGFDPQLVADFDGDAIDGLMQNSGIVRHKAKILSAVQNAKVVLQLQKDKGSLDEFIWSFVPNKQPIVNSWTDIKQIPTKTPEAEALSKALKSAGMSFVGPTTMYAFMQAAGLINDHMTNCHCYRQIIDS